MANPLPEEHIRHLAELLAEDQLVLFVGAGISRQATAIDGGSQKMPLWSELGERVAEQCGERLDRYDNNVLDLFDAISANHSRERLEEAVRRAVPDPLFRPCAVHEEIARLPWHVITTTNYDSLLGRACGETQPIDDEAKYAWYSRSSGRPRIVHLHGSLANLHTLTGTDYGEWSEKHKRGYAFLEHVALNKTILFVGYSFSDPHLRHGLLPRLQTITAGRGGRHFAWMWSINPEQVRLYDSRKITALPIEQDTDWLAAFQQLHDALTSHRKPGPGTSTGRDSPVKATQPAFDDASQAVVNGYKLFFHRTKKQQSVKKLSHETGIDARLINNLEQVKIRSRTGPKCFKSVDRTVLARIEKALDCVGKLEYGQNDDFLAQYLLYYKVNKNPVRKSSGTIPLDFVPDTKAVVFDFGGTLTISDSPMSTWEKMWDSVGYTTTQAGHYHRRFLQEKLSHQGWCDITAEMLALRGFSRKHLVEITKGIRPVAGLHEALQALHEQGSDLYIVSGSVRDIIIEVLGESFKLFKEVRANEMVFDRDGLLGAIRGTKFDFEGKAEFIRRVIDDLNCQPMEVLFVGNSLNDVWASRSGARTLCVNPSHVDFPNTEIWTDYILEMKDLSEILGHARRA